MPLAEKEFLSDVEVERLTGISKFTLRSWRSRGGGPPYVKVKTSASATTGKVLYEVHTLRQWLTRRTVG